LSPIYFSFSPYDRRGRTGLQGVLARRFGSRSYRTLRVVQRAALAAVREGDLSALDRHVLSFERGVRYVLDTVDALLPNSEIERFELGKRFEIRCPVTVVPNGVDSDTFNPGPEEASNRRMGVLCVGRLQQRKNQLALIRALRASGISTRFVGRTGRFSRSYARRCRKEAGPEVSFLGHQPATRLCELYRTSQVHVSTSWFETPGLASLEAAACGCAVVVTRWGCTQEYFGEDAHYCDPDDLESIRTAVRVALAAPPAPGLAEHIGSTYSWEQAARRTVEAYRVALERSCDRG
jgi:glycosyltransferase involved in cell wall biosynthesis